MKDIDLETDDGKLGEIVDELLSKMARGESIDIEQYTREHPDIGEVIKHALPALQAVAHSSGGASCEGEAAPRLPNTVSESFGKDRTLGDFRILRELGRGGMGIVYEAEQISLGRRVALKVLPFAGMVRGNALQRFHNEVRAAATLDHPNIVSVYSVGEERGVHYYAMQLIQGQSLAELDDRLHAIQNGGRPLTAESLSEVVSRVSHQTSSSATEPTELLPSEVNKQTKPAGKANASTVKASHTMEYYRAIATLAAQAADALEHAHQNGVIHRDIKPGNLLLDSELQLYVTDFGLARIESDAALTMTGDLIGTLRYMSPEQALAKRIVIDHRSDVYSLGMTLYELLTLQPAFLASDRQELLKQIAFEDPVKPRQVNRAIPPEIETIVLTAIEKNPEDRYATAAKMAADLRAFLDDRPIAAKRPSLPRRISKWTQRNRAFVATAAISVMIAWLVSSVWVWRERATAIHQRDLAKQHLQASIQQRQRADTGLDFALDILDELLNEINESQSNSGVVNAHDGEALIRSLGAFFKKITELDEGEANARTAAAYRRLGDTQRNLGQLEAAQQSYDTALRRLADLVVFEPNDADLKIELAQCYIAYAMLLKRADLVGKLDATRRAISILDKVPPAERRVKHAITDLKCRHQLALQLQSSQPEEAVDVLTELIDRANKALRSYDSQLEDVEVAKFTAHHSLGQIHRAHTGSLELAEEHLNRAIGKASVSIKSPPDARRLASWLRSLGMLQRLRGKPSESIDTLHRAYELFQANQGLPEHFARVDYNLAQASCDLGRLTEAADYCRSASKMWSNTAPDVGLGDKCRVLNLQASLHRQSGDFIQAEAALREAIRRLASTKVSGRLAILSDSYASFASLLQDAGDYQESIAACSLARKANRDLNSKSHRFLHLQAMAALQSGRTRVAMREYEAAIKSIEDAEGLCLEALLMVPDAPMYRQTKIDVMQLKAKCFAALQDFESSAKLFDTVEQEQRSLAKAHPGLLAMNLENVISQLTNTNHAVPNEEMLTFAEQAVKKCPENPRCWLSLALARYRLDLLAESLDAIDETEQLLDGNNIGAYGFLRAMCHHKLDNVEEAREWFRKASDWTDAFQVGNQNIVGMRSECVGTLSPETSDDFDSP